MAYVVLVVNVPGSSIQTLNDKVQFPTKAHVSIDAAGALLESIAGGAIPASVQVTVRDTDPSVSTSGTGSTQSLYDKS